jgi:hypothetical protein
MPFFDLIDAKLGASNSFAMNSPTRAYAPASEPFGTRLETFFIALCVALGDIDGKPFSVAKIAAYMRVPRTTVTRQARSAATLGSDRSPGPSLLHTRETIPLSVCEATNRSDAF